MIETKTPTTKSGYFFKGIPVSPGVAIGKAFVLSGETVKIEIEQVPAKDVDKEIRRFEDALEKTREELKAATSTTRSRIGSENAKIFEMHNLVLDDPVLKQETIQKIRDEKLSAEYAFYTVMQKYQDQLASVKDEYFQMRSADLRDVKRRVIRNIQGDRTDFLQKLEGAAIIIARDLTPSDTVALDRHKILGFATDMGGKTSHSAIMARSFRVPAVVGLRHLTKYVKNNDRIVLDGNEGVVYVNPDRKTLQYYQKLQKKIHEINRQLTVLKSLPARTLDGREIELAANLEFTDEVETVIEFGARGIGLYRTDYLFLARTDLPTEDEQFEEYKAVVERMRPYPVIIRTLDVGGDKNPQNINIPPEANPYLGYRAIRICLERPEVFLPQLRAILRASAYGNIKILFPMISSIKELREAKMHLEKARRELRKRKVPFSDDIEVGVMIEVPSAAIIADLISREVDFLSIGTNDLVQYLLAVDRGNERIAYLYQDLHPAVLRTIRDVVQAAHRNGTWVGVCGEMGGNPLATLILLGLGIDEISVSPIVLPEIKKIIRSVSHPESERIAEKVLSMSTAEEIEKFMMRYMRRKFKDLIF
ncbi:MAG: phosphoenolpyruvate--protein phosphotransferase [candidate division KSB1 bacterium]|nr:phosphoenolpyruvate--protein phosphotransferase [candidate division KSB1 bacterium]MDQ7064541.1 phosphoenolpyruvate--protein phosphotransferase [candidate division KSB1 bacterium]